MSSFDFSQFHFIRPDWFWALLPLALIVFWHHRTKVSLQWQKLIPAHLAQHLINGKNKKSSSITWLLSFGWLLSVIALAGPAWDKIDKPVFEVKRASVIIMDMSMSLRATDVKPNRLTKSRFKAIDLANALTDGEIGLIAYAGDAFVISPLTPDSKNITSLIPSLSPEIMPESGSYPLLAFEKAQELLQQAGYLQGDIYWFTDGIEQEDLSELRQFVGEHNLTVNILAVGTLDGAPIKMVDGSLLKDHRGNIVIPKVNTSMLAKVANLTGGVMVTTTSSQADINALSSVQSRPQDTQQQTEQELEEQLTTGDDWHEFGPVLILLVLVLLVPAFRKGMVFSILVGLVILPTTQPAFAIQSNPNENQPETPTTEFSWLDSVFKTQDQRGQQAYDQQDFVTAQQEFESAQWRGSAAYKAGDYKAALSHFEQDNSADGFYNQGNALAQLNKFDDAIKAYEQALKLDPTLEKAQLNKTLLETAQQQQNQQDNSQQNDEGESDQNQQGGQDSQSQQQQGDEGQQSQSDQQNSEQDGSEQQNQQSGQQSDSNQPTPSEQESEQQTGEQGAQEGQEGEQQEGEQSAEQQQAQQASEQEGDQEGSQQGVQLTPEEVAEQENQQKLQQLLRKVSDDPSVLLRNKMILESRKRQQQNRKPKGASKSW